MRFPNDFITVYIKDIVTMKFRSKLVVIAFTIALTGCSQSDEDNVVLADDDFVFDVSEHGYIEEVVIETPDGELLSVVEGSSRAARDKLGLDEQSEWIERRRLKKRSGDVVAEFVIASGDNSVERAYKEEIDERLQDNDPTSDSYWDMVEASGGMWEFSEWLKTASDQEVQAMHQKYGLFYGVQDVEAESRARNADFEMLYSCEPYLSRYANSTWDINGVHRTSIDAQGRPFQGIIEIELGLFSAGDLSRCRTNVGGWSGRSDDQGGHLIPKALGGWHYRLNLTPQNKKTNNDIFNGQIENAMRACAKNRRSAIKYGVLARYPDQWNLRPEMYEAEAWISRVPYSAGTLYQGVPLYFNAKIRNETPNAVDKWFAVEFKKGVRNWCGV